VITTCASKKAPPLNFGSIIRCKFQSADCIASTVTTVAKQGREQRLTVAIAAAPEISLAFHCVKP
jgi:hypothetical protein